MRALFIFCSLWMGRGAVAKDLGHRLGVGYADQFGLAQSLPSLAARFYPGADYGVQAAIGLNTPKDDAKFGLQLKALRTVFREQNLNFFVAALVSLISDENHGHTSSGFGLAGTVGAEFFFAGLENLGFNFEAGIGITSLSSEVRVRTIGDHPLRAGILFYF